MAGLLASLDLPAFSHAVTYNGFGGGQITFPKSIGKGLQLRGQLRHQTEFPFHPESQNLDREPQFCHKHIKSVSNLWATTDFFIRKMENKKIDLGL